MITEETILEFGQLTLEDIKSIISEGHTRKRTGTGNLERECKKTKKSL